MLFAHVANNFGVSYGPGGGNGLVSVEYMFKGESAHAAGAPWRGRSALDAVELMDVGWNFRREHLRLATRVHYVITNGGDQPNVVPPNAAVWYYFREADYDHIMNLWHIGDNMAQAATLMTDTTYTSRLLGSAWPGLLQQADRRGHVPEHQEGRIAAMVGRRSDACQSAAARAEGPGARAGLEDSRSAAAARIRW